MRNLFLLAVIVLPALTACNVAPKSDDRATFVQEARDGLRAFERQVPGLRRQIAESAGYAVFPGAGQWGIIFTGGSFGRGAVFTADGTQIGWAAENQFNVGLQAGGQQNRILIVFADSDTLSKFQTGLLTGGVQGMAVGPDQGTTGTSSFQNGLAVYVGGEQGLMAGGMIGMENFKYRALGAESADGS